MAKVLISLEDALLRRIDRASKEAMRHIDRLVARNGGDGEDSTSVIRDMRDSR